VSKQRWRHIFLFSFLLGLLVLLSSPTHAQTTVRTYWQYDATGEITALELADLNDDGLDEFVLTTDHHNVITLSSGGQPLWPEQYTSSSPVVQVTSMDRNGTGLRGRAVALITTSHIILLNENGGEEWSRLMSSTPVSIISLDYDQDGLDELLISLSSGQLRLYSSTGQLVWRYTGNARADAQAFPLIQAGDVDRDGLTEIAFSYFTISGFSELALINSQGAAIWDRAVEGRVTTLTLTAFDSEQPLDIAIGTNRGRVHLIASQSNNERWFRTLNKAITVLQMAAFNGIPHLLAGTEVGRLVAYTTSGRPIWDVLLSQTPDRSVVAISPNPTSQTQPIALAVSLAKSPQTSLTPLTENNIPTAPQVFEDLSEATTESTQTTPSATPATTDSGLTATTPNPVYLLLLGNNGDIRNLDLPVSLPTSLTRIVDINRDDREELLLVGFSTLELIDPGFGPGRNVEYWNVRLDTRPQTALVLDIEEDQQDELLIGSDSGDLYLLQSNDGASRWHITLTGAIRQVALASTDNKRQPGIVVITNESQTATNGSQSYTGSIQVLQATDGLPDPAWGEAIQLPVFITTLLVADINQEGRPEILIGTIDGQILAYSLIGELLWQTNLTGRIDQLIWLESDTDAPSELLVTSQSNLLSYLSNKGIQKNQLAYLQGLINVQPISLVGVPPVELIIVGQDGIIRGLTADGREEWAFDTEISLNNSFMASDSIFVATTNGQFKRLIFDDANNLSTLWQLDNVGRVSAFHWGDLNGDTLSDVAIGNQDGTVFLYTADRQQEWDRLSLPGDIFLITSLRRSADQPGELAVITSTGLVRLYQKQVNHPPLLFNPNAEATEAGYSLNVSLINLEQNETVRVQLELYDPTTSRWVAAGERTVQRSETLFWLIDPPATTEPIRYRFVYQDEVHTGFVEPQLGPSPLIIQNDANNGMILVVVMGITLFVGLGGAVLRRSWQPDIRARRFYRRLQKQPATALNMLKVAYNLNVDAPGFLLSLANQARLDEDRALAGLVDGLYLLAERPEAALPIILSALEDLEGRSNRWHDLSWWQATFRMAQQLLSAPSITELSLLRPQLVEALHIRGRAERSTMSLDALLPILIRFSDSERVEEAGDRLVYLHDAENLLYQLQERVNWQVNRLEKSLVIAITVRWLGLTTAAIEEIHGQASLDVRLKTRRLVAETHTELTIEIKNTGRAPAENITVTLEESPAFTQKSQPQTISFLPSGRGRQVNFTITPEVTDRFRLVCQVSYDDRHRTHKTVEFADMVHLLPPIREFTPVTNPYSPGTPLRRTSNLFVGRERFFRFIAENAGHPDQNRVLIMVGQRRTGKTSALLRLDKHLPEQIVPVYIDCQSLGVVEGMTALLYDLAWAITDALKAKGYSLTVPERSAWEENPTHLFQRQFIPQAQALLPPGTTLLLVFDEFEAFENLVNEGILPSTFFTYLRHLMQHGKGLGFVFVGTHRLEEMSSDYWSVLFNIALHGEIGFLDDAAATHLITDPVAPYLVYDDLALDKILRVTAGHPYFLQLVCYTLVNRANEQKNPYITISDVNATLDQMLSLGEAHFAYLWQQSSQPERALLTASAYLMDRERPFHPSDLLHYLSRYNISLTPTEVTTALNRLVLRGILREVGDEATSLYELKIGLVGLWVARNKSLSKLYESNGAERVGKKGNAAAKG
jgi:outer membrane protein assembly factor BamB